MAFRGRGRGRGPGRGGGFGSGHCRQEEFVLFPDVELPDINSVVKDRALVAWNCRLESFWQSSPYHLKVTVSKEIQETDIERFSDRGKQKSTKNSGSIAEYMKFNKNNFPLELFYGRSQLKKPKKVRWNPDSDLQKLDFLENLEQKHQGQEGTGGKEKNEDNNEDEDEDAVAEDEEFSDDGDYNQNIDFDDDEDDYNMADDNDDEGIY
ncbi:uncharacterized protein LOC131164345 isoform X5 [Malania oleifera]|uniref:uncharacterized protein LOC131164345 isoform X5 n=1 Tax=Malania oleifera TaxID=397392 RepID=UPI0025AE58AF|nr:uncharacterized protein LOC131164345 isoform X5 [Malania oleifera]XP_057977453.1 uncharacterized protein LOC131164345 isoform X5 [Malania oleifera]